MIKLSTALLLSFFTLFGFSQGTDSALEGKWKLFEIIDNMSGEVIKPSHKSGKTDYPYTIEFIGNTVKYNLEINKCSNEIIVEKDRSIQFKYFSECTEICCDDEFSKLLSYEDCNKYYIKEGVTLILVSEDRIFYFKKA